MSGRWEDLPAPDGASVRFVDDGPPARQLFEYRIRALGKGKKTGWSNVATAVAAFRGMPLHGWLNVRDYYDPDTYRRRCGGGKGPRRLHPIQCAR